MIMESKDRITLICPNLACRRTLHVPPSARGVVMRCVHCGSPFRVPDSAKVTVAAGPEEKKS